MEICFKNTTINIPNKKITKQYALILSLLKKHNVHWSAVLFNPVSSFIYTEEVATSSEFNLLCAEYLEAVNSPDDWCDLDSTERFLVGGILLWVCGLQNVSNSKRITQDSDHVLPKGQDYYDLVMDRLHEIQSIGREAYCLKYPKPAEVIVDEKKRVKKPKKKS